MTLRILLVSVEAPPANNAEALQVAKVLYGLRRQNDFVLDVVTADTPIGSTATLTSLLSLQSDVHPSQVVHIHARLPRWQRALIRLLLPWLPHQPDWSFLFALGWRQAIGRLRNKPDLIYSRSFPPSSTVAALKFAKYFRVPWFLHLSDPWTECTQNHNEFSSRWHSKMERRCLSEATRISFTSPITLRRYQERYPEIQHRMVLDPNTYDMASVNTGHWQPGPTFRVVHTGSFTLKRRPDSLLAALSALGPHHPLLHDLELIHAGPVDAPSLRSFRQAGPWLYNHGLVEPDRALALQQSADLLLAIDWEFGCARDAQYLLSKLTDYLAIRRPVLLITNVNSASWEFVHDQSLGIAVAHKDIHSISQTLLHYWQAWKQRRSECFELPPPDPTYSAESVAAGIARAARHCLHGEALQ